MKIDQLELQNMLSTYNDALIFVDGDERICFINSDAQLLFGYTSNEVVHRKLNFLIPDHNWNKQQTEIFCESRYLKQSELLKEWGKVNCLHKDGIKFPCEAAILRFSMGNEFYTGIFLCNLSQNANTVQSLIRTNQNLQAIFAAMKDVVIIFDRNCRYVYIAPTDSSRFTTYPLEMIGKSIQEIAAPEKACLYEEAVHKVFQTGAPVHLEYDLEIRGEKYWFDALIAPFEEDKVIWFSRDVSNRKQAEEALQLSRERYKAIVEDQTELICRFDEDLKITFINQAFSKYFGKSQEECIGKSFLPLIVDEDKKIFHADHNKLSAENPVVISQHRIFDAEGNIRWTRWIDRAIYDENGKIREYQSVGRDNTDLIETNLRLEEARTCYRNLVEQIPTVTYVLHAEDCRLKYISPQSVKMLGFSKEELFNQEDHFCSLIHPDDLEAVQQYFHKKIMKEDVGNIEYRIRRKDGEWIWVQDQAGVTHNSDGSPKLLEGILIDITERRAVQEELNYQSRFESFMLDVSTRFINVGADELDREINLALQEIGQFTKVDRAYVFLFETQNGLMRNTHEWCNTGIDSQIKNLQSIPMDTVPWWMEKLKKYQDIYLPAVKDMPPEAKNEKKILEMQGIQSLLVVPMVSSKALEGFIGFDSVRSQKQWSPGLIYILRMVGNIFASALNRVRAEKIIRSSEERKRAIIKAIPDMMLHLDDTGLILDISHGNPDVQQESFEYLGDSLAYVGDILPMEMANQILELIPNTLETGAFNSFEYQIDEPSGQKVFDIRFSKAGQQEVIVLIQDISERAMIEKMKSNFINRASHELRTPLTTISLMVDLIEKLPEGEDSDEYWEILKSELKRETSLIEDLLMVGKLERDAVKINFLPINTVDILCDAVQLSASLARDKNIQLNTHFAANLPRVDGDVNMMHQIFSNLLTNAVKFSSKGGQIEVTAGADEGGVAFIFQDYGIGIPDEDQKSLFDQFFRASNAVENEYPGSGVGLFIVKSLVEKMKGKVKLSSELGKGTIFTVWFPVAASERKVFDGQILA